jgi:DNA repair protein SbcC/Rad50
MHRNNLPTDIINSALPLINSYINKLLKNIADFMIDIKLDDDKIKVNIIYNNEDIFPIEASSGMESIVSELAIRSALMQISNKTNYNFLIVDEGFSTLDSTMFPNLENVFNILKRTIDHVLIVSHIETMKDMVDKIVEITIENGYSKINL